MRGKRYGPPAGTGDSGNPPDASAGAVPTGQVHDASLPPGQPVDASVSVPPGKPVDASQGQPTDSASTDDSSTTSSDATAVTQLDGGPYMALPNPPAGYMPPTGPRHVVSPGADVTTTREGGWYASVGGMLINALTDGGYYGNGYGIELESDGTFVLLGQSQNYLVPYLPTDGGPVVIMGTWTVNDASASRGPNAWDLVVNAPTGAVYTEQVLMNDNPQVLGLVYGINAPDELVRPLP